MLTCHFMRFVQCKFVYIRMCNFLCVRFLFFSHMCVHTYTNHMYTSLWCGVVRHNSFGFQTHKKKSKPKLKNVQNQKLRDRRRHKARAACSLLVFFSFLDHNVCAPQAVFNTHTHIYTPVKSYRPSSLPKQVERVGKDCVCVKERDRHCMRV